MDSTWNKDPLQSGSGLLQKQGKKPHQMQKIRPGQSSDVAYLRADLTKFTTEASIDDSHNVTAGVMFEAGRDGLMQCVSGSDPKYWSQAMKDSLGLAKDGFSANFKQKPRKTDSSG